jgi:hypothetical protein
MNNEPVAWLHIQGNHFEASDRQLFDDEIERGWEQKPLYTHPAKTLTDAELASLIKETHKSMGVNNCTTFDFIKAFLKKAQEK